MHVAPHRGHPTAASHGCSPAILFVPVPGLIAETGMIPQPPAMWLAHGAGPASLRLGLWKRSDQPRSRGQTGPRPTTHTYWLLGSKRDGLGSHAPDGAPTLLKTQISPFTVGLGTPWPL